MLEVQPDLYERVHWPVEGDHLFRGASGDFVFRYRGTELPIAMDGEAVERALIAAPCQNGETDFFLFGLGLGEILAELLARRPEARATAWDRDPWVLRQVLSLNNFAPDLRSGRLRFELGADLVQPADPEPRGVLVEHPLLAAVYRDERLWLDQPTALPRALVCTGNLFVDSVSDALRNEGFGVLALDAQRLSVEEIALTFTRVRPELVACINHVDGLAEFCEAQGVDLLCWEIDPATDRLMPLTTPSPRARVFTYRERNVKAFQEAGFERVEYLPLAADPARRRPLDLSQEEHSAFGAPVSFVGTSMVESSAPFEAQFQQQLESWKPAVGASGPELMRELLRRQRADYSRYMIEELLEEALPGFSDHCRGASLPDPAILVAEIAAAEKRLTILASLARHGAVAWGDAGWRRIEAAGVEYRGPARHEQDLPRIYNASTINLDIGRLYQADIVTMRVFDVLACGGFILAEHSVALEQLFDVGVEVESWNTVQELEEKVVHYLANPGAAKRIAERGRAAVLARHQIAGRVKTMLGRSSV